MGHYRVASIVIDGMRSIDHLELDLAEPTVLIGPNGSGKSTIIEACALLRKAGSERPFVEKLFEPHGGATLLRLGAQRLQLGVQLIAKTSIEAGYELSLRRVGSWLGIEREFAYM